ncbi:MAG TPA: hypothetical protein DCY13_17405 [Verrucomicrobiales bacterium]|nr:hypothetical protein [Verrucomicrobiales bacterium]
MSGLTLVLTCFLFAGSISAQPKIVRLRNGAITNEPSPAQPRTQALLPPASGLFLVQFTGPVQGAWRQQLADMGVRLLRYVPDDTFIARVEGVPLSAIRSRPFVHWVGEYQANHKIHSGVTDQLRANPGRSSLGVRVMLSPDATLRERAELYRRLGTLRGLSRNRFGDVLQGEVPPQQLTALLESPAVLWVEGPANMKLSDEVSTKIVGGGFVSSFGDNHLSDVQQLGYTGDGVTVAVADSGLNNGDAGTMHPDLFGRVVDFHFYGDLFDAADEHAHGTHVTGIVAGNGFTKEQDEYGALYGLGVAPDALIVAQRIFDGVGLYQPPESFEQLTRDAVRSGADIGSNSWGDDTRGRYDISAAEFDALVRDADFETPGDQPYILEFSAGNAGPVSGSINSPAVAKNVIATGASQNDRIDFFIYADGIDAMADFSSRGPCEDGRIKPDLVAPGTWIASLQSASATDQNAWAGISPLYQYQGGTSQAGPHVSGAAAAFVQFYRELFAVTPSPAMVKAAFINSAWDMDNSFGTPATPNMDEGWGRLDLPSLINFSARRDFIDQTQLLGPGQVFERRAVLVGSSEPLVVTLTYTDVPGLPAAIPALVNDLDLEVIAPDGKRYRGNVFDIDGLSVPEQGAADRINNVEGIYIDDPAQGEWLVRVIARNVVEDARIDTLELDQDFALVVSAELPAPDAAVLFMDRSAYRAPSEIRLKLFDFDQTTQNSQAVTVSSSTEAGGFTINLLNTGSPGVFTGTVATATAPAVPGDGLLQLADGDLIQARYFDESRSEQVIARAFGDFQPPQFPLTGVTNRFGRTFVRVHSDEQTTARVFYGTNIPPTQVAMTVAFRFEHEVELKNLVPGETYRAAIELTDIAGNTAVYDNAGNYITFVAIPPATVLLVNAYTPDPPDAETIPIPLSSYTDALNDTGVTYQIWDKESLGPPSLDVLSPYRVVIWRLNDSLYSGDTINANEQGILTAYLNGGGGLLVSSMELISRLGPSQFRTNVLQVDGFLPNTDPFGEPCSDCDEDYRVPSIVGEDFDPVSGGVFAWLDYSAYPVLDFEVLILGPDFSDTFTPTTNAVSIFYEPSDKTCAIRFPRTGLDSPGRVVFMSFPIDTIPLDGTASGRSAVMGNALRFLAPGLNGLGSIALDNFEYTIPDNVIVEVADSDLEGLETATVKFFSSRATAGVDVTLTETITPGLFRGTLTLVAATEPAAPGRLPVADSDVISARYLDASFGANRTTFATIDTVPPSLSNIFVDPQYTETLVEWEVDEYTDALVEYGESPFFSGQTHRTAHNPRFTVSHSLLLTGLQPDRTYYYRITSRDIAGNATTVQTDAGGQPLTFRTLKPLTPPWHDNLEAVGLYDWDVFSADDTEGFWQWGVPNPAGGGSAHSGASVWATNLGGDVVGYVESFLISPPVELNGGNRATLKFWHDYDFIDRGDSIVIEFGQLMLITNSASAPIVVAEYFDWSSFGWEEQEIDLSPHLGKVVYMVWYYAYFTIENSRRRGWMIDDVSVTVEQITPGTLVITNNLAQAQFNLSGPINRTRQPWYFHDTNAPPGDYSVSWVAVPHYQTPSSQDITLQSGSVVEVTGNYTMVDSNGNGISDSFEQQYFGNVNPNHAFDIDSDGDGASDGDEFLAGTNPTNAASLLMLGMPLMSSNNVLELNWPTANGRIYRLESSTNVIDWRTLVDWYRSTSNSGIYRLLAPTNPATLFRLKALP